MRSNRTERGSEICTKKTEINEIFERKRKEDPKSTREIVKEIQEFSKRGFVTLIVSTLI